MAERIATAQGLPFNFLDNILSELCTAGVVRSQRGPEIGYRLASDPAEITIADIIRAVEGPAGRGPRRAAGRCRLSGRRARPPPRLDRSA